MWCSGAWDGHQPCGAAFDPGVALQVEAAAFPEHDVALLAYAQPAFTFFSLEPGLTWFVGISTTSILAGEVTHQFASPACRNAGVAIGDFNGCGSGVGRRQRNRQ